jgi:hypothetical protein
MYITEPKATAAQRNRRRKLFSEELTPAMAFVSRVASMSYMVAREVRLSAIKGVLLLLQFL